MYTQESFLNENINTQPLADKMRPRNIDEMLGQEHLIGKGKLLRTLVEKDKITSCIFYGPTGSGKTTLANIISLKTKVKFFKLNAVTSGVAEVREVLKEANDFRYKYNQSCYLFLDECHRWSKAQSDSILPAIESGLVRFIGSTTENPGASMTPAIVSRCRIYKFLSLTPNDIKQAIKSAIIDKERGYGNINVNISSEALDYIATTSGGDVRQSLCALELAVLINNNDDSQKDVKIGIQSAKECVQTPLIGIDKQAYYDMISALIKSMRGSDSNAAVFWLAALLNAGVDPKIIARRLIVHASEDVGLADPIVILQAHAAIKAVEFVGMPEARIPLAQAVIAIAEAEKSNSVVTAIDSAMKDTSQGKNIVVPPYLRDYSFPIKGEEKAEYLYPHIYKNHIVKQNYMPNGFENKDYYIPSDQGFEVKIDQRRINRKNQLNNKDNKHN